MFSFSLKASHFRAGQITYKVISVFQYEITLTIYTKASTLLPSAKQEIDWGDGTKSDIPRVSQFNISGADILVTTYVGRHIYPDYRLKPYLISFTARARNANIINIPNSAEKPFYLQSEILVNPFLNTNNSVQLLQPPIQNACVNTPFVHSPAPYDSDGDSLVFSLQAPRESVSDTILGYIRPLGTYTIDKEIGTVNWNSPSQAGEFNIAYKVEEYREGLKIGSLFRDMQVTVGICNDKQPIITSVVDTCTLSDDFLSFDVKATDAATVNKVQVNISAIGGIFNLTRNSANFRITSSNTQETTGKFSWFNECSHIQKSSHIATFIATERSTSLLNSVAITKINVVGNKVNNLSATINNQNVDLKWDKHFCNNEAIRYDIYRRNDTSFWNPSYCQSGIPSSVGFTKIFSTTNASEVTFSDVIGKGVFPGNIYCYRVVPIFKSNYEGKASDEVCVEVVSLDSRMKNVSVTKTGTTDGEIFVRWTKTRNKENYTDYVVKRENLATKTTLILDTIGLSSSQTLDDTTYTDLNMNTLDSQYAYHIDVIFHSITLPVYPTYSIYPASSVYLSLAPESKKINLKWNFSVPWSNVKHVVYRKNDATQVFDSLTTVTNNEYTDNNLINGKEYCYKVKTKGYYSANKRDIIENFSEEICAIPRDITPPCPPILTGNFNCLDFSNEISWTHSDAVCASDAIEYRLYKRKKSGDPFVLLDTYRMPTSFSKSFARMDTIYGCYKLLAVDNAGNISDFSNTICYETCPEYRLPNVFTPNKDNRNDKFKPFPYRFVESIDIKIYSRWGRLVFKTNDRDINWDGTNIESGKQVSDGTYFYTCIVNKITVKGIEPSVLKGTISIFNNNPKTNE